MTEDGGGARQGVRALASVFLALTFALSMFRFFDADEMEHVHSTWHVLHGAVPYVDFFQHHHPLLWYVLAPRSRSPANRPPRSCCSGSCSSC